MNKKNGLTHRKDATESPLEAKNSVLTPTSVAVKALVKRETEVIADKEAVLNSEEEAGLRENVVELREKAVLNREEETDLREDDANLREEVVDLREETADKREKAMRDHKKRIRTKARLIVHKEVIDEYDHEHLNEKMSVFSILTAREREVLKLIAEGSSTAQIAAGLTISTKTVDTHRQHIMDKLNIRGIADLTRYAIRAGISHL
jgi:DNA-binding CsgD family transcriptional regulator